MAAPQDPRESPAIRRLARQIAGLQRQVTALASAPSLSHSTIEGGAIDGVTIDGQLTTRTGEQHDGTFGSAVLAGPVPPTPTTPLVEGGPGLARLAWDGDFRDGALTPMDFARVEVYVSTEPITDPLPRFLVATIETPQGAEVVTRRAAGTYYVRLASRSLSGKVSALSDEAVVEVASLIDTAEVEAALATKTTIIRSEHPPAATIRTNLAINPLPVGSLGWLFSAGTGGTATLETVSGADDGPEGRTGYRRARFTAAPSGGSAGPYFRVDGSIPDGAAGEAVPVSVWVRCSSATGLRLSIAARAGGAPVGPSVQTDYTDAPAGTWVRLDGAITPGDAFDAVQVWVQVRDPATALQVRSTVDAGSLMIGDAGDYFDGDTPDTASTAHAWLDEAHASASTATTATTPGAVPGDVWWRVDGVVVVEQWVWDGHAWVPVEMSGTIIAAATIHGEQISATALDGKIITGALVRTAAEGRRIELGAGAGDQITFHTGRTDQIDPGLLRVGASDAAAYVDLIAPETAATQGSREIGVRARSATPESGLRSGVELWGNANLVIGNLDVVEGDLNVVGGNLLVDGVAVGAGHHAELVLSTAMEDDSGYVGTTDAGVLSVGRATCRRGAVRARGTLHVQATGANTLLRVAVRCDAVEIAVAQILVTAQGGPGRISVPISGRATEFAIGDHTFDLRARVLSGATAMIAATSFIEIEDAPPARS